MPKKKQQAASDEPVPAQALAATDEPEPYRPLVDAKVIAIMRDELDAELPRMEKESALAAESAKAILFSLTQLESAAVMHKSLYGGE